MRLMALVFTAILVAPLARAQRPPASAAQDAGTTGQDTNEQTLNLPVSLDKIKERLQQTPALQIHTRDEGTMFRVQILERQKIEELLATLKFKKEYIPAGGVNMQEQQRVMFPSVDNPLVQPLGAFSQSELLVILVENLAAKYFGGKVDRARAEAAAREEVRTAVAQYCNAQPNAGAGLALCASLER
jgi:hypothetical protein